MEDKKPNLQLLKYAHEDAVQNEFIEDIEKDKVISEYITGIVNNTKSGYYQNEAERGCYLIKEKNLNKYIGIAALMVSGYDNTSVTIDCAVHQNYRHTEKKYGTEILKYITELLFTNHNVSKVILEIKKGNKPSIASALNNDFDIDYDLLEIFNEEGYMYIPYSKSNPNYQHTRITENLTVNDLSSCK